MKIIVSWVDFDFVETITEMIKDFRNLASMQQDLIKGKKKEIDYLDGAVIELGKKHGVKCPVNEGSVMIIKRMEKNNCFI